MRVRERMNTILERATSVSGPVCLPAALMDAGRMQCAGRTGRAARVANINE